MLGRSVAVDPQREPGSASARSSRYSTENYASSMSKESFRRAFFSGVAVVLAAWVVYTVVRGAVEDFTGSSAHEHHGRVLVAANVVVLGGATFVAWLALLSWRRAKSN